MMTAIQTTRATTGLAVLLSLALAIPTQAGEVAVAPSGPVFTPPVFQPTVPVPQTTFTTTTTGIGESTTGVGGTTPRTQEATNQTNETKPGTKETDTGAEETDPGSADAATQRAVRSFVEAQTFCANVPDPSYQIDCLADQLGQLVQDLPQTQEFAEARQIVQATASRLERVARRNASTQKRPARLRRDSATAPKVSRRAIVPVAPERLAAANQLASSVLREAETLLLRASEQSDRRKVAFTQIAEAVGSSSTILLRAR